MTAYGNILLIEGRKKCPDFIAKTPTKRGWKEVGVAFYNSGTESFTIYLDVSPLNGKIVLFKRTMVKL